MAAKIGVLGESTSTAGGTIYTVPASKAAKIRLQWYVAAPGGGATVVTIAVNGITVFKSSVSANQFSFTGGLVATPSSVIVVANTATDGIQTGTHMGGPTGPDLYLSAADTVAWTLGSNTPSTAQIQVVGVEDDAA